MARTRSIDFWFSIGSTYTYLSVMRLADIERATGIRFQWRPFSVRVIMSEVGNSPRDKPVKLKYMWRDLERRAGMYGIPIRLPVPYPLQEFDLANKVAVLASEEGWCSEYVGNVYRRWFQDGLEPGIEPYLSAGLHEIGQKPLRVLDAAAGRAVNEAYVAATDQARQLGIFGSPTFAVETELFWGDDRLEDAVSWYRNGRVQRVEVT